MDRPRPPTTPTPSPGSTVAVRQDGHSTDTASGRTGSRTQGTAGSLVVTPFVAASMNCSSHGHKPSGAGPAAGQGRVGSAPPGTRTPNPLIKSQLLCQLS